MKAIIIEDEPLIAEDLKMHIEAMGIQCLGTYDNKQEATAAAEIYHPDFALVDLNLNGNFLGIEIARELRFRLGIQIIFVTSYSSDNTLSEAEEINPADYLVKPFSAKQLEVSIKRIQLKNQLPNYDSMDIGVYNSVLTIPVTQAEFSIWKELALGKSNKEISQSIGISENTIKTHLKSLFVKLDCTQRSKAVEHFFKISSQL